MKIHEIITENNAGENSILIEELAKYAKQLYIYYNHYFPGEPVLMVTSVTNACQYAKIVSSCDFEEAICQELGVDYVDQEDTDSDKFAAYETICANSIMLKEFAGLEKI